MRWIGVRPRWRYPLGEQEYVIQPHDNFKTNDQCKSSGAFVREDETERR